MEALFDQFGREITYIRLAITDRCNLRCFYCMPAKGIEFVDRKELLSFEEMEQLLDIFSGMGVNKVRITGGEPFVRRGTMEFIERIALKPQLKKISITTNGTLTRQYLNRLKNSAVKSINLSLDTMDKQRFFEITRRDEFDEVWDCYRELLNNGFEVKINMVVMEGRNTEDIIPMLELAKNDKVSVRFIEEMPFNGTKGQGNATHWPSNKILDHIKSSYPQINKLEDPTGSTSVNYQIPGFEGTFGIIAAYSRTFCGSCNRIRLTPQGELRTCLYSQKGISLRDILRSGANDSTLQNAIISALNLKPKDGFEAENMGNTGTQLHESMASIGG